MNLNIGDIRIRLDQQAERIISGLKDRSRYLSNQETFDANFSDGFSWFEYRLRAEQSLDAEFGRFEFEDQHPVLFTREDLASPRVKRSRTDDLLLPLTLDLGHQIIEFYREVLNKICRQGEDQNTYGETVKLDVNNVLSLYERICGIGPYVAESKIRNDPSVLYLVDTEDIRTRLTDKKREEKVIERAVETAARYKLPNPEAVRFIFTRIIDLTLDVEVKYVEAVKKQNEEPEVSVGWGQVSRGSKGTSIGFGSQ